MVNPLIINGVNMDKYVRSTVIDANLHLQVNTDAYGYVDAIVIDGTDGYVTFLSNTPVTTVPLPDGYIYVGGVGNVAVAVQMTGDVTISGTGVTTVNNVNAANVSGVLPIGHGGTGQVTANAALNALLPSQTGNNGLVLGTDGVNTLWVAGGTAGGVEAVTASLPIFSTGGLIPNIFMLQADTSHDGYLTHTDWNTFNNKQNALTFGSITTPYGPFSVANGANSTVGPNVVLTLEVANTSQDGYLTHTDWNTFNNKVTSVSASAPLSSSGGTTPNITTTTGSLTEVTSDVLTITGTNTLFAATTIKVTKADSTHDGYLSSADWTTFNSKENAFTHSNLLSAYGPLTVTGGSGVLVGSNATITLEVANGSQDGYLTHTDWTTFNNKQNALTFGSISSSYGPLSVASGANSTVGPNVTFTLPKATSSQDGYLTQGDWTTFNNKPNIGLIHSFNVNNTFPTDSIPAGLITGSAYNTVIGVSAGTALTSGADNTLFGAGAGSSITTGSSNTFIGFGAGNYSNGDVNVSIGDDAGFGTLAGGAGSRNVNIGAQAAQYGTGSDNVVIGQNAGNNGAATSGSTNVVIGVSAGAGATLGSGNVFIGYQAGYNEAGSNLLYIANSSTTTPLIYGDFSGKALTINGTFALAGATSGSLIQTVPATVTSYTITWPSAQASGAKYLKNDGAGTLSWATADPTTGNLTSSYGPLSVSGGTNALLSNATLTLPVATTSQDGYLSHTDWNTFNNKGTVSSVTSAYGPLSVANSTTTPVITLQVANTSQDGYLTHTDWNTFNNKQNALTNPVTGTGTSNTIAKFTGTSTIGNSTITDNGTYVGFTEVLDIATAGNSYNEGIRIHPSSSGDYASLVLGAVTGQSGTGAGQWTLIRFPTAGFSNKFSIRYNATDLFVMTTGGDTSLASTTDSTTSATGSLVLSGGMGVAKNLVTAGQISTTRYDNGNSGTAITIDWNKGNVQDVTLNNNCTLTFSNQLDGGTYTLLVQQDSSGSRTVTWPGSVVWPGATPTLSTGANAVDMFSFVYDSATGAFYGVPPALGSGTVTSVTTAFNGTSANAPIVITNSTTTPLLTLTKADGTHDGYLTQADWTTFNNKQNALTNPVTGTGTNTALTKWTGTNTVSSSSLTDDGTTVTSTEPISSTNTTDATSFTTGAIYTTGGIGVTKALFAGHGLTTVSSEADSFTIASGNVNIYPDISPVSGKTVTVTGSLLSNGYIGGAGVFAGTGTVYSSLAGKDPASNGNSYFQVKNLNVGGTLTAGKSDCSSNNYLLGSTTIVASNSIGPTFTVTSSKITSAVKQIITDGAGTADAFPSNSSITVGIGSTANATSQMAWTTAGNGQWTVTSDTGSTTWKAGLLLSTPGNMYLFGYRQSDTFGPLYQTSAYGNASSYTGAVAADKQCGGFLARAYDGSAAQGAEPEVGLFVAYRGTDSTSGYIKLSTFNTGVQNDLKMIQTGQLQGVDGTVSLPMYSFGSDTSTGIYRIGTSELGISLGGTKYIDISTTSTAISNVGLFTSIVDVTGPSSNYQEGIRVHSAPDSYSILVLGAVSGTSGTGAGQWTLIKNPSNQFTVRYNATDNIIVPSGGTSIQFTQYANGTMSFTGANGTISSSSDARLKTIVDGTLPGLNEILQLTPRYYKWNSEIEAEAEIDSPVEASEDPMESDHEDRFTKADTHLGFIAQEVGAIIPEALGQPGSDGYYGLFDRPIIAALVQAVKELKAEVDELKAKLGE